MKIVYALLAFFLLPAVGLKAQEWVLSADAFEKNALADSVQLLDVRTAGEFASGHLPHALQADWTNKSQFTDRVQYIDKNKTIYVYCLAGSRSAAAAAWMRQNGFQRVYELQGGINAWKAAGKPVEGLTPQKQMTQEEYYAAIPQQGITLVDFSAAWCPPCVKMQPVVQSLQQDKKLHFHLITIDAGVNTDLLNAMKAEPIPTFIIYRDGREAWRKSGVISREEIEAQLH